MQNVIRLGNIYNPNLGTSYAGNVWDKEGICPHLDYYAWWGENQ